MPKRNLRISLMVRLKRHASFKILSNFTLFLGRICDIDSPELFNADLLLHSKIGSRSRYYRCRLLHDWISWNTPNVERKKYANFHENSKNKTFFQTFVLLGIELIPFGITFFCCLLINIGILSILLLYYIIILLYWYFD